MLGAARTRTIVVTSIGSGSISVGIAVCGHQQARLVASERRTLPMEKRASEHTAASLKQQLTEAGEAVLKRYRALGTAAAPVGLHCVIRAPWTHSEMVRVENTLPGEARITSTLITELARRALPSKLDRDSFLEASTVQLELNGYPTKEPEGKRAHHVAMTALISSCQKTVRNLARDALSPLFSVEPYAEHSGTRAILEALADARPDLTDCLVLDVAEEGTAAILVRAGAPEAEAYLSVGLRHILSRASSTAPDETLAALRMMAREQCDQATCVAMQEGFAKVEPELAKLFGEFFAKLSSVRKLPNTIVLMVHPDIAEWLSRFLARIDFTQFTLTAQPFQVVPYVPATSSGAPGQPTEDIDLSLALALINKDAH